MHGPLNVKITTEASARSQALLQKLTSIPQSRITVHLFWKPKYHTVLTGTSEWTLSSVE